MRAYHKSWQNKRPGFTERVKWYQGPSEDEGKPGYIRLNFVSTTEGFSCDRLYATKDEATVAFEAFIAGEKMVSDFLDELEEQE